MSATLLLDRTAWDLVVDAYGNIAVAAEPYALAQDAASTIRTFLGECFYDTSRGLPYRESLLGYQPPRSFVEARVEAAVLTVPGVAAATATVFGIDTRRRLTGEVQLTNTAGQTFQVGL